MEAGNDNEPLSIYLVQWSRQNIAMGRSVSLDNLNRIVCPVNFASPARRFDTSNIIMPAVGETVRRVRKENRPVLPPTPLRLLQLYKAALCLHARDMDEQVSLEEARVEQQCALCGHTQGPFEDCVLRRLTLHPHCSSHLTSENARRTAAFATVCAAVPGILPNMFPNVILAAVDSTSAASSSSRHAAATSSWQSNHVCMFFL